MIKVRAIIELNHIRTMPFFTGYRPSFLFVAESYTTGLINLIGREDFRPGETGEVEITFIDAKLLGKNFGVGTVFTFGESPIVLGTGHVLEILEQS